MRGKGKAVKRKELRINQGGLMRCCLQSAALWADDDPEAEVREGERFSCRYHGEPDDMIVQAGVIQWAGADTYTDT